VVVLGAAQDPDASQGDPAPDSGVVGDRSKRTFHRPDCSLLKRVPMRFRTELDDAEAAAAKGYRPCPVCKPDATAAQPENKSEGARTKAPSAPAAELTRPASSAPPESRRREQAKKASGELDEQTKAVGLSRWKKASSEVPSVTAGGRFLLFSTLPPERAKTLLKTLEAQALALRSFLQATTGPLAGPEKISLYVFRNEKGYIEFVRANEGREVEAGTTAHAKLGVESPYLAAIDPLKGGDEPAPSRKKAKRDDDSAAPERTLAGLLTEQLASGAVASAGEAPRWLSLGLGAWMASAVEPRSPYYRSLRATVFELYRQGWMTKTREGLGGQSDSEQIRAVGFSLIEFLSATNRAFLPYFAREMIQDNRQFDNVIQMNLGVTPEQFFQVWGEFVAARYGRGR
jgi:hypothetical protein